MSKSKFKVGQVVSYRSVASTKRARKGGIITKVEKMYELKDKYKRPNAGELTTIRELSKGKTVGYAYRTNSIQPKEYKGEISITEEDNLVLTTKKSILDSYNVQYV